MKHPLWATVLTQIDRIRLPGSRSGVDRGLEEAPLRAELFSADQMAQHGASLAASHELTSSSAPDRLLLRLAANEKLLVQTYVLLTRSTELQRRMTPAGEWLLDNFHFIEEEIRTAKRHLPPGYSRALPRLRNGPSADLPRVYDLALQAVAHGDARLSRGTLSRFLTAYQAIKPLQLGELWAVPIMLRLALIENLRRLAVRIGLGRNDRNLANVWADKMLDVAATDPKNLILVIADMARSEPPMTSAFVAELARRLQGRGAALALPLTWMEQRLVELGQTVDQLVQAEAQTQSRAQVSVSNSIGGLRVLGATDWRDFVEALSLVEQALRQDPADVYAHMDFTTRDRYRHVIETLARSSPLSELEVAQAAVALAAESVMNGTDQTSAPAHLGYYLIGAGADTLLQRAKVCSTWMQRARQLGADQLLRLYSNSILLLTLLLSLGVALWASHGFALPFTEATTSSWWILPGGVALLLSASQLAVALVNWVAGLLAEPRMLPRMDYETGIAPASRTLVVVPTLIGSAQAVEDLADQLEVRFLANRDPQLYFALLTDFNDAVEEICDTDDALLQLAAERIEALNRKHESPLGSPHDGDRFFLLHRPRRWNMRDRVWMGHERKRGKLADLNALLRGHASAGPGERFARIVGDTVPLRDVRYVITLDTDTQMPRDSAWRFVATMAHPLNRPRFGGVAGAPRVVEGYGILQPRVGSSMTGANCSRYAQLVGGEPGIDPYTRAVSDVYQDLFGEGSFIGKGIYDVDAFEHVMGGRLSENRILSHDLLEGCYARSGLISDVELIEEPPSRYDADVKRRHRWIRGDWQIIGWLMPWVKVPALESAGDIPTQTGRVRFRNPLSTLSRWKIVDNLRRSLVPAALTALFVLGWSVLRLPWIWTLAGVALIYAQPLLATLVHLLRKPEELRLLQHLGVVWSAGWTSLGRSTLSLACLPYEAAFSLDAVVRTLWRLWVTKRRLLEWQASSASAARKPGDAMADLLGTVQTMWVGPLLAAGIAVGLSAYRPMVLAFAAPVLLLWFVSPLVIWWLNQPLLHVRATLSAEQADFLRLLSRRTWAFFETFVGPKDNFLPPDNMQEDPVQRTAHRTSPTNIGLALLANLAAHDFGYLTLGELIERTSATLESVERLEKHRGHLFNWYDTETLEPLRPRYVSTVDSGNLAGHLLTLRAGLVELGARPHPAALLLNGLADTLRLLQSAHADANPDEAMDRFALLLDQAQQQSTNTLVDLRMAIDALVHCAHDLASHAPRSGDPDDRADADTKQWARALQNQCQAAAAELEALAPETELQQATLAQRTAMLHQLAERAGALARMEWDFLYDPARSLLSIGFNLDERRLDPGCYDLLASEARLTIFTGIAQGALPQASWFSLGRLLTTIDGRAILMSWSGSMFEYLMPMLVMPSYEGTLLDQTVRAAVERQISYGRQRAVPWGISESGYNATDGQLNYQYRAFGVPGLGLKRGLADDLVVAPYATVMALMVDPRAACQNLERMAEEGLASRFGYYEAIDYTPSRLPRGQTSAIVRSYMAHHQGMSLLSLASVLLGQPMQRRFVADPELQATLLLLHERAPKVLAFHPHDAERPEVQKEFGPIEAPLRVITTADTPAPEVQLLSNGRYHVMLTHTGAGVSRWKDLAVTRWREDTTCDNWGSFCFLRDTDTGAFWSTTHQPTLRTDAFEAIFSEGRAEFRLRAEGIDAYTEIVVSPEDDIELRRLRLRNLSGKQRSIELTSYAEVVIAPAAADAQHPAFSKLFVQTEVLAEPAALLCTRRPRSSGEQPPHLFHLMAVHGARAGAVSHETDRVRFIGRGRSLHAPQALLDRGALSGSAGSVLDPVVATRRVITLEPDQTATIDLVYGMAMTREACVALVHKYVDRRLADRVLDLSWTHSQVVLRQINASEADAQLYARLAGAVIYTQPLHRAEATTLLRNHRGQSDLWAYAISGDLPIVLLQIGDAAHIDLVQQMVQAHAWWRLKGLAVDLVIWNEERDGYQQHLQEQILGLIAAGNEVHVVDRPGGIFVRHAGQIGSEDRILLQAVARVIINDQRGSLEQQAMRKPVPQHRLAPLVPTRAVEPVGTNRPNADRPAYAGAQLASPDHLIFDNGLGGFAFDGREYVIAPAPGQRPPAPWVNVLANPRFGTVVSEAGSAYTWCENAHELRLTPWHNDPVTDAGGEAIYLRDEASGQVWSPTSLPGPADSAAGGSHGAPFVTRHGFGYSVFEHDAVEIHSELTLFVALDAAVKFSVLVLRNDGDRVRRLSATGYVEWVLGDMRATTAPHIGTEIAESSGALYARNPFSNEFGDWIGFFDVDGTDRLAASVTGDRTEFIGRNGSLRHPAALRRKKLSGRVGVGLDPCAAIQVPFDLAPGQTREIVFRLGIGRSLDEADKLVQRYRGSAARREALDAVHAHWRHTLGAVQVNTPDASLNLLANGWLVYQTLACRMWARSGYYQSGGAFGFRDQLQDAMALVHTRPEVLREHLLLCASRQFVEGDVQHWWHPPAGRGVRTHISDDYLWLPLALCRYLGATNDSGVLDASVPFLEGRPVPPADDSYYDLPQRSDHSATLYQHAVRAVQHGMRYGTHGLPLMGSGDWNDGMNEVGHQGRGESVWLGFFFCDVLRQFAVLARRHGDLPFARQCDTEREKLALRLEENGWDGDWYRRAYFDDSTPLGSKDGVECQIDSIAQSWAVLSGVGRRERVQRAMDALAARLVRPDAGLVQLLDPPFDGQGPNPGYIAGYVPGVRENGGQYTHSAVWAAMAFAAISDASRAWQVMDLINPLHHGRTAQEVALYKVEPYVVAADVYSVAPHTGRGGWSWYTGSAGWMYRLIVESLLGIQLEIDNDGARLYVRPCMPADWPGFSVAYRFRDTLYEVQVEHADSAEVRVDGVISSDGFVALVNDGGAHVVVVRLRSTAPARFST
ncbi:MAG: glucoamylase family protein [Burkholderiaceae bacterium]